MGRRSGFRTRRARLEHVANNPRRVRKHVWRARFLAAGVDGLLRDAMRPPGRKPGTQRSLPMTLDHACSRPSTSPPAPLAGVPRLPRSCRRGDSTRMPGARHPRQRLLAQVGRGSPMAEEPSRSTSPRPRRPGGTPSRGSSGQRLKNAVFDPLDAGLAAIKGTIMPTPPVRSAGAGSPRTASRRGREDTTSFTKGHQMNEAKH